jgi:hypothetical protein
MYRILKIKSISKFSVFDTIDRFSTDNQKGDKAQKINKNSNKDQRIDFSFLFWQHILSKDFLEDFLLNKYVEKKAAILSKEDYNKMM